jgi:hypothetical protein
MELTAEYLRDLEERASALLGERYASMVTARSRGIDHPQTPPKNPHRLINNLRRIAASREAVERGGGAIDPGAITEVHTMLSLLEGWRGTDYWPTILAVLPDADNYAHTILTLATHKAYSDIGNLVHMVPATGNGRSFDLSLLGRGGQSLSVEVKAPRKLRDGQLLTPKQARSIVFDQMKGAGPSEGGQLAPDRCGILMIGGFRLRDTDLKVLKGGASALFSQRNLGHIAAIAVISLGVHLENVKLINGNPMIERGTSLNATVSIERCPNPRYLGVVPVATATAPGWKPLGPHTERDGKDDPSLARYR